MLCVRRAYACSAAAKLRAVAGDALALPKEQRGPAKTDLCRSLCLYFASGYVPPAGTPQTAKSPLRDLVNMMVLVLVRVYRSNEPKWQNGFYSQIRRAVPVLIFAYSEA